MRVVKRIISILVLGFGTLVATGALALDDVKTAANGKAPLEMFKNPQQALNKYIEGYRAGDSHASIEALRYAAEGGEAVARWKLASMYAEGDGVPHDDAKAFEYFESIVEAYDETNLNPRERGIVASAFVAVGTYALNGIANTSVGRDTGRAYEMFSYAATEFGDPHAQYNLGMMYLDGTGVTKDVRRGARWLRLAADKQHMESQAVLGRLYFNGIEGVQRQRALGLMYLTMAREAAGDRKKDKWVVDLYDTAMASASDVDRQAALAYLEGYVNGHH